MLVKFFAGGGKRFRGAEFEIPKFILHAAVELFGMFLSHHVEFSTYHSILEKGNLVFKYLLSV